jgi:hypothetical protein
MYEHDKMEAPFVEHNGLKPVSNTSVDLTSVRFMPCILNVPLDLPAARVWSKRFASEILLSI